MGLFRKKPVDNKDNKDIFSKNMDLAAETISNTEENVLDKFYTTEPIEASTILCIVTSRLFNKDVKKNSISKKEFETGLELYMQVWIRKHGGFNLDCMTTRYITGAMLDRYGKLNETNLDSVLESTALAISIIYRNEPDIKQRDQMYELLQSINPVSFISQNAVGNMATQHEHEDDADWGLVAEKPVFVAGFGPDKEYLSHIHTEDGKKLSYVRNGSLRAEGVDGMVDKYTLYFGEEPVGIIYLCNYGTSTPTKAPAGYKYI